MLLFVRACRTSASALAVLAFSIIDNTSAFSASFDVKADPAFANIRAVVSAYARAKGARGAQDFCALGQVADDQSKSAWVIWPRKQTIFLWEGQDLSSVPPRRVIDLRKDVVASERELHGSSYRVTRKWVGDLRSDCNASGMKFGVQIQP